MRIGTAYFSAYRKLFAGERKGRGLSLLGAELLTWHYENCDREHDMQEMGNDMPVAARPRFGSILSWGVASTTFSR